MFLYDRQPSQHYQQSEHSSVRSIMRLVVSKSVQYSDNKQDVLLLQRNGATTGAV